MAMVNRSFILLSLLCLSLPACSKKPVAEDAPLVDKMVSKTPNPQLNQEFSEISKNMEARQYDAAVGSLVKLKQFPKTDAERKAYEKELQQANDMLSQKAAQGDEQAAQSYRILGRFMTGR
jgi:hypothetical protein